MLFTDSFISGGTERQFLETLRLLDGNLYDVFIGCLKLRGPFLEEIQSMGFPLNEFPIKSLHGFDTIQWFRFLVDYLKREKIDIVHAFDFYTSLFAVTAARWAGTPVAIASRRDLLSLRSLPRRMAIRFGCVSAHAIVANSRAASEHLFFRSERKVRVIPNVFDPSVFCPKHTVQEMRKQLGLGEDTPVFGTVAAMRPEKGHRVLLHAARKVFAVLPKSRLILVGDGVERQSLEALTAELGITSRVLFMGDRKDVPDLLSTLDVAVIPSDTESLSNSLLEAMGTGRAVVATNTGGTPEACKDGETGYLVPPGKPDVMASRIIELLLDHELRLKLGSAAREKIINDYSPQTVRRKFDDLYQQLWYERGQRPRVLQISNYPPPMDGWAIHVINVKRALTERGIDSRVLDIGPGRRIENRDCDTVRSGLDYISKLLHYRRRGFLFQPHVNGDSWKGYILALMAAIVGRMTGKPAVLMFHAGPKQEYFPRKHGLWFQLFKLLFNLSGEIICNFVPVKEAIAKYNISQEKIHAIFSVSYVDEDIPVDLPSGIEQFLASHNPCLFSYTLFRPEFTNQALFSAFTAVRTRYPNAGLLIAGPTSTPPEIASLLRQQEIDSDVHISGNMPHPQFLTSIERCSVFIRTHLRDGLCASVLESLRLGVPVVASEDGMRPPSAVTFVPGDENDLAQKILFVLGNLETVRASIVRPDLNQSLEEEINLLLRMA